MITVVRAVGSGDLPQDLSAAARGYVGRKVSRLLDRTSLPPFVAANQLVAAGTTPDAAGLALLTVSAWEADVPGGIAPHDGTPVSRAELVAGLAESITPTRWLSGLPNNVLCQIAIATGIRGPNAHLVGDADALVQALLYVRRLIDAGKVEAAVIVAFDPPAGLRVRPPNSFDSDAAAILVAAADNGPPIAIEDLRIEAGSRAVDLIDQLARCP